MSRALQSAGSIAGDPIPSEPHTCCPDVYGAGYDTSSIHHSHHQHRVRPPGVGHGTQGWRLHHPDTCTNTDNDNQRFHKCEPTRAAYTCVFSAIARYR